MEKKYYLGIDGGGTKTAFVIMDEDFKVVETFFSGPTSIDTVDIETFKKNMFVVLDKIKYNVCSIFAGLGGVNSISDKQMVIDIIKSSSIGKNATSIHCENDVINALYGSLDGSDGVVLIAGTGSVAYGLFKEQTFKCGGYGYQEGDGGSSFHIGHLAIQYLARVFDSRLNEGTLSEDLKKTIQCFTRDDFVKFVVNASRTQIASLAKVVTENENDYYAKKIVISAVNEAFILVKTVIDNLHFDGEIKFSIVGSLGNANTSYKKMLLTKLKRYNKNIKFTKQKHEASYGAALLAKNKA